jgi:hypothetical protein
MTGNPKAKHISTSYVERQNLTMRMQMRRFTRLTNAFSKKVQNLGYAVALHFMHYNFCRVHQTLRVTHVHCVVPAGGLSPDHTHWVRSRDNYFLPKEVLREVFRGKLVAALKQAFQNGQLNFQGDLKLLAQPKIFAAWLRPLYRQDWVVYLKPPFGGPEYVLQYLGRYTHRVAISNHRLVSFADGQVIFRWRDSADHNKQKLLPLSVDEFLCRFLLHVLPQGFVRIRHFGFLANRRRTTLLPLCF